ncbi:phage tail tape measure protein [Terribacillus saccharophilus]|uniref:Phage tail tape measure protein n=2 Tax=Terribacillus saccharophilus TaxID=361277 RepID=A0ABX4GTC3_9BACI|nr:phage tail tape measure protein [Terribacillus saccharophilus]PAD98108.1 phage tail tape measure protein [Terribacillus saccharophilus]
MAQNGKPLGSMIVNLGLDGSSFSKSLDGIKRQLKTAQSELKANLSVVSQAGDGYLTMKTKVEGLNKVMAANQKQIEILHERYSQAKKDYGENSKEAQKYATQINNAVARQSAMQKQLEDSQLAMKEFQRGTKDLKTQIDQAARSTSASVSVLKAQGKEYQAAKAEKDGLTKSYRLQTDLIEQEKQKLEDLISTKGEDSRETREQKVAIEEAIAKQKLMKNTLDDLEDKLGSATDRNAKFADSMAKIKEQAGQAATKLKDAGREASMKVTLPIVGAMGAAVKTSMDFEAQMSRVGAIAGSTGGELDQLKESALDLGASTSKSATEVAQAQENLAALGFTSQDIISAMPGVISAAEASGAEMAQTADVVASALNIWGLEAGEASRVADVLAESANATAADITDMQYAFKYAGAPAAALGVSMEETAASIGIMTNAGLEGENAGTALRASLLALLNPSEKNSKTMEALGISVTDAEGNFIGISGVVENFKKSLDGQTETQKAATIASLVGTEATSGFLALMNAGPDEIDKMTTSLENSGGASAEAAKKMKDNLKGALEELGGAVETAGITIGNVLTPAIQKISAGLQDLVTWFNDLSPGWQKFITYAALAAAAVGPLLVTLGILAGSISNIAGVVGMMGLKFGKAEGKVSIFSKILNGLKIAGAALLGPFGLIVAAIAAVVAGFILAYKKIEPFRDFVNKLGASIMNAFGKVKEFFSGDILANAKNLIPPEMLETALAIFEKLKQGFQVAKDLVMQAVGAISTFFMEKVGEIKAFWDENGAMILEAFRNIFGFIKTVVTTTFSVILAVVKPVLSTLWTIIQAALPPISALFKVTFGLILTIIKSIWGNIQGVISGALNVIMGVVKIFAGLFTGNFSKMWEGIKQAFSGAVQFIWNFVQLTFFGKLLKGVGVFAKSFGGFFKSLWNGIKNVFSTVIGGIVNFFKNSFTNMLNTGKSIFTTLKNFFSATWSAIKNIFWTVIRAVVDFVKSRFTNLKNNTTSIFTALRDTAKKIWNSIKDNIINPIKNAYSSVIKRFGDMRDKGLEIFRNMKDKVSGIFDDMVKAIKGLPKRMGDGLSKAAKNIAGGVKNVSKFLLEGLAKGVNGVGDGINWILDKVHAPKKLRIPKWNIPEYAKGTDNHPGGPAIVSDGKGKNKQELIQTPDGRTFLSPKRETILNLPKGTSVLDGNSTAELLKAKGIIPAYNGGKGYMQAAWDGAKSAGSKIWGGVKSAGKATWNVAKKVGSKAKEVALDVWDYVSDPLSLIKKMVNKFTNLDDVLEPAKGIATGMISKATDGAKDWIKGLLEGGDVKSSGNPTADVKRWVSRAMEIAGVSGKNWLNGLSLIAMRESGGNPKAVNNWDINAKRGIPSKGLMQTIEPTFNAFKKKGYGNILNPVHNALAAIGYIKSRYKTIGNVPGVKAVNQGKKYVGYENGGFSYKHKLAEISEGNKPEAIVPLHKSKRRRAMQILAKANEIVGFENGSQVTVQNDNSGIIERLDKQLVLAQQQIDLLTRLLLKNTDVNLDGQKVTDSVNDKQGQQYKLQAYQKGVVYGT